MHLWSNDQNGCMLLFTFGLLHYLKGPCAWVLRKQSISSSSWVLFLLPLLEPFNRLGPGCLLLESIEASLTCWRRSMQITTWYKLIRLRTLSLIDIRSSPSPVILTLTSTFLVLNCWSRMRPLFALHWRCYVIVVLGK